MCGEGRFVSLHGDVYEGGWWVHGQRSGQGVSTVMPPDERGRGRERAAQKVSAQLLAHRRKPFLRMPAAGGPM